MNFDSIIMEKNALPQQICLLPAKWILFRGILSSLCVRVYGVTNKIAIYIWFSGNFRTTDWFTQTD